MSSHINGDYSIAFWGIAWYGIFMGCAILTSMIVIVLKLSFWYKIPNEPFYYFCFIGLITSMIGARFGACILEGIPWSDFFNFRGGGMSIFFAVIFTTVAGVIYFNIVLKFPRYTVDVKIDENKITKTKPHYISIWVYADAIIPAILIGQVVGRWGNYFNQEIYGNVVDQQWIINLLKKFLPYMYIEGEWRHPLFFYESFLNFWGFLIIFVGLEFIRNNKIRKCGDLAILYFIWYGIVRIIFTSYRESGGGSSGDNINYAVAWLYFSLGLFFLILNHTLFLKTRKYFCIYAFFNFSLWKNIFLHIWFYLVYIFATKKYKDHLKASIKKNNLDCSIKFKRGKEQLLFYNYL